jgi:hypothetical protein
MPLALNESTHHKLRSPESQYNAFVTSVVAVSILECFQIYFTDSSVLPQASLLLQRSQKKTMAIRDVDRLINMPFNDTLSAARIM